MGLYLASVKIHEVPVSCIAPYKEVLDTELFLDKNNNDPEQVFIKAMGENMKPRTAYMMDVCNLDEIPIFHKYSSIFVNKNSCVTVYRFI